MGRRRNLRDERSRKGFHGRKRFLGRVGSTTVRRAKKGERLSVPKKRVRGVCQSESSELHHLKIGIASQDVPEKPKKGEVQINQNEYHSGRSHGGKVEQRGKKATNQKEAQTVETGWEKGRARKGNAFHQVQRKQESSGENPTRGISKKRS